MRYCLIFTLLLSWTTPAVAQAEAPRIVSLHDTALTIPLIELGVTPVGSHGRLGAGGKPFIRSGALLTGWDFANSPIAFVGDDPADPKAIAALAPDLILTTSWQSTGLRQLQRIAPTEVIAFETLEDDFQVYELLAERLGRQAELQALQARHSANVAMIQGSVGDTADITVNVILPANGQLRVWRSYYALGRVLRDAGFSFPPAVDGIGRTDAVTFSAEMLQDMDADILFIPFLDGYGQGPEATAAQMEEVMPDWCKWLEACRNGRVVWVPRSIAGTASYAAMAQMAQVVASHMKVAP